MNATVKEWIDKAEGDYATASREVAVVDAPNYDAVCFHSQQCIEKLMKALLIERGVIPPKTHDLNVLDHLLSPKCPEWRWLEEEVRLLSRAAVASRYPGEMFDKDDAIGVFALATRMRQGLLPLFSEGDGGDR